MDGEHDKRRIRVGSRKSQLALIQTRHVISLLSELYPELIFEIHTMSTVGDRVLNISLPKIGEKSLFTKDLEEALRNGSVDFVVHSLKDLPTSLPNGMAIGAVLKRESPLDALILNEKLKEKKYNLKTLPKGSVIGTSSLRRTAQLQRKYPHLVVNDIRGNLNTRKAKLNAENSKFSGLILAKAGIDRMDWGSEIDHVLEPVEMLYAVGQGALAVECLANNDFILEKLEKLCCYESQCIILTERSFLKCLGGGCSAPVAVATILTKNEDNTYKIEITGAVWSLTGKEELTEKISCDLGNLQKQNGVIESRIVAAEGNISDPVKAETEKRKIPELIDDTKSSLLDGDFDVETIVNIHGKLLCPYASQQPPKKQKLDNEHNSDKKCPMTGVSATGKCPYNNSEGGSKLTSMDAKVIGDIISKALQGNGHDDIMEECPIPIARRISMTDDSIPISLKDKEINIDKCPFIKMIDCDENRNFLDIPSTNPTEVVEDNPELLCGLICHKTISREVLEKCQTLGRTLAENLIKRDALGIIKAAQNEIHSKT